MLKEAGFDTIIVKTEWASRYFDTKKDLFNWVFSWIPYVTGFEKNMAIKITNEIVKTIAKEKEKNIEMRSPLLYIKAEKPN